ncbi:PaaI family thioesterase [Curvivirga sp.]|uniref:PaaI family thioesterase n=1 Tax=Curvivirga sp. TaxID=2856848 RepID=UPI003B59469C
MRMEEAQNILGKGFQETIGYKVVQDDEGRWVVILDVNDRHLNQYGVAHGGVALSLMDAAGGMAIYAVRDDIQRMATISMSQNFLSSAKPGTIIGVGEVERMGKAVGYSSMRLYQDKIGGELIATAQGAYRLFIHE